MARRTRRTPPTPRQRAMAMTIGVFLIAAACIVVLAETIINEGGRPITLLIVAIALFIVFILPIVIALRGARRRAV